MTTSGSMVPKLYLALTKGDKASLESLLLESPSCLDTVTVEKNTALHIAARLGYTSLVSVISHRRPSLFFEKNSRGDTPVHCAARAGHKEVLEDMIRICLSSGNTPLHDQADLVNAEQRSTLMVNELGESAVYIAAERGAVEMVRMLLPVVGSVLGGPNGQNALHAAVCRSYEITEMLLEKIPHLSRGEDAFKSTPLHYAASLGDHKMVQLLLDHDAPAAYLRDKDGLSPIHVAARMDYVDTIKRIAEACPDAVELIDKKGQNLVHAAAESKALSVIKYVIREPAFKELLNEQDHVGNTPLHIATIGHNYSEIVDLLLWGETRLNVKLRIQMGLSHSASFFAVWINRFGMLYIKAGLASAPSRLRPQRMDLRLIKSHQIPEEEIKQCRDLANNLTILGVLIATVTFAAAFTMPGGYINDNNGPEQGMAILAKATAFKVFLVSDTVAMLSSIFGTYILIYTGLMDHHTRLTCVMFVVDLMLIAVGTMVAAFVTGIYAVVASKCLWLAILIMVLSCLFATLSSISILLTSAWRNQKMQISFSSVWWLMPNSMDEDNHTPLCSLDRDRDRDRDGDDPEVVSPTRLLPLAVPPP